MTKYSGLPVESTSDDSDQEDMQLSTEQNTNPHANPTTPLRSRSTSRASKRSHLEDDPDNTPKKPPTKRVTPSVSTPQINLNSSSKTPSASRPICALTLVPRRSISKAPLAQDSANTYGTNPFISQSQDATSPAATQTNPSESPNPTTEVAEWVTSPPAACPTTTITKVIHHLQQAEELMRKMEDENFGSIEWPASFYNQIKSICNTRSTDKTRLAIQLSHLGGNDLLIELAKMNTMLTETFISSSLSTDPPTPPPPMQQTSYATAIKRPMPSQAKPSPTQPKTRTEAFHKARTILRFDPPWPHYKRLEPQELTKGLNEALERSSAPRSTRVKAVSFTKGGHLAVWATEPCTGDDLIRYASHLTTYALERYPGRKPSTTCEAQPDIVYHRIQLNRAPVRDFGNEIIANGQTLLENLVNSNSGILKKEDFAELPKWAVSQRKLEQLKCAPIVISLKSEVLAAQIQSKLTTPITFQGATLSPSYYRQRAPIRQCKKCNSYKHATDDCQEPPSCAICAGNHLTTDHKCTECEATMLPCGHSQAKCANCGGAHTADDRSCEARAEAISEAKATNPKPDLSEIGKPSTSQQQGLQAHPNGEVQGGHKRKAKKPAPKTTKSRKVSDTTSNAEGDMEVEPTTAGTSAQ